MAANESSSVHCWMICRMSRDADYEFYMCWQMYCCTWFLNEDLSFEIMTSASEWKKNELFSPILVTHSLDKCPFICHILVALPLLFGRNRPHWASSFRKFLDHTQRRIALGRTPLDGWSARRRGLCLTTHNTRNRQTSMSPVGFEPTVSAGEQPQTYALDRATTGTG